MSPPTYYLINKTQKEFCSFDNRISIFKVMKNTLKLYTNWTKTDNICIDSEDAGSTVLLEYLINSKEYTCLDYIEEPLVGP